MKLIDTTVAVDHLRGDERATALLTQFAAEDQPILASELMRFELLAGMRPNERDDTEQFFSVFAWVPVDEHIARLAGGLAAEYRKAHRGIGAVDFLLAATASVVGAELVTTNVRHFPMFPDLVTPYAD